MTLRNDEDFWWPPFLAPRRAPSICRLSFYLVIDLRTVQMPQLIILHRVTSTFRFGGVGEEKGEWPLINGLYQSYSPWTNQVRLVYIIDVFCWRLEINANSVGLEFSWNPECSDRVVWFAFKFPWVWLGNKYSKILLETNRKIRANTLPIVISVLQRSLISS